MIKPYPVACYIAEVGRPTHKTLAMTSRPILSPNIYTLPIVESSFKFGGFPKIGDPNIVP